VPSQAASIGYAALDGVARTNAMLFRALGNSPRDAIGLFVALLAAGAILTNALYMQPGPHPAPIFSVKPRPVAEPAAIIAAVPRARPDIGPRVLPAPVVAAPKVETVPLPTPSPRAAVRDPIADLIAPQPRVTAVQRALNDYGYGPVKATGVYGAETVAAIEKFERDRKLPVTGQISPRLMRELAALTGRPLE
jgi:Putative peptidoglycan binding domain